MQYAIRSVKEATLRDNFSAEHTSLVDVENERLEMY
jgi:hypothetical protein